MELNHYGDTVLGVVATEDIVEGRMVLLAPHSASRNFGSQADLPGVKLPDTSDEAARARYITKFEQDNRSLPIYQPQPAFDFALRYGFDQAENAPFSAEVFITHPGVQEGRTIPSGSGAVVYGEGIYTVASGAYVYSADIENVGAPLTVADTASDSAGDAGKPKYSTSGVVGEVIRYDSETGRLTFKILH